MMLQESSQGWMEDENNYEHFVKYILGIITAAYRDFLIEQRLLRKREYLSQIELKN